MNRTPSRYAWLGLIGISVLVVCSTACYSTSRQRRANVLEYLYPEGKSAAPATNVRLELPLAVGLAFVPESSARSDALDIGQQEKLLKRVKKAFGETEEISRIEVVPSSFVVPGGGFENVDQIRRTLGIDLIALVSFDQTQFDDPNMASLTYWTIVGAYVVPGNENETHTFVNASVFDIDSRALLFNAPGKSVVEGSSTAVNLERSLREDRAEGFEVAVEDMITNLQTALGAFREQIKTGTVRGEGTPAVEITSAGGGGGGGVGAGALGALELGLGLVLVLAVRRRTGRA